MAPNVGRGAVTAEGGAVMATPGAEGSGTSPVVNTPAEAMSHTDATAVATKSTDTSTDRSVLLGPVSAISQLHDGGLIPGGGRRGWALGRRRGVVAGLGEVIERRVRVLRSTG